MSRARPGGMALILPAQRFMPQRVGRVLHAVCAPMNAPNAIGRMADFALAFLLGFVCF
jgi:hypothetical protein